MNYLNIEIQEGVDYVLSLTYRDDVTGLPKDITGYRARLSVKPYADMPAAISLTSLDYPASGIFLDGPTGSIDCYFTPDLTTGLDWLQAPFDLLLTDTYGVGTKIVKGLVTIVPTESI